MSISHLKGKQGRRNDLKKCITDIENGKTLQEIALSHPQEWIKYHSGLKSLHQMHGSTPPIRRSVTTTVLWGPTGTGKSHRVRTAYPEAYIILPGRDPFGAYTKQETVIWEEFNPMDWPIRKMNVLLDVWRAELDCRYMNKWAHWTKAFILANTSPITWYCLEDTQLQAAFNRRLTYTIEILNKEQELLLIYTVGIVL